MIKLGLLVLVSGSVATGQALLATYARGLEPPLSIRELLVHTLSSAEICTAGFLYLIGIVSYIVLLRWYPLVEVNLTLMILIVVFNLAYSMWLGQHLTYLQWSGVTLACVSLIALQSSW